MLSTIYPLLHNMAQKSKIDELEESIAHFYTAYSRKRMVLAIGEAGKDSACCSHLLRGGLFLYSEPAQT